MSDCGDRASLIQADLDGELDPAASMALAAHVKTCPTCTELQAALAALSVQVRAETPYFPAPASLHQSVRTALLAAEATARAPRPARLRLAWLRPATGWSFAAGALAAGLAAFMLRPAPGESILPGVMAAHVRATQPGHLLDVLSEDRHTVKPWFEGRLDFAPPVLSFPEQGFVLAGGRLDYLAGRPVAALVYRHDKHAVNLFVWPGTAIQAQGAENGFAWVRWSRDGMVFWAVSDLSASDMAAFAGLWRDGAGTR